MDVVKQSVLVYRLPVLTMAAWLAAYGQQLVQDMGLRLADGTKAYKRVEATKLTAILTAWYLSPVYTGTDHFLSS